MKAQFCHDGLDRSTNDEPAVAQHACSLSVARMSRTAWLSSVWWLLWHNMLLHGWQQKVQIQQRLCEPTNHRPIIAGHACHHGMAYDMAWVAA